ncbi:hypothetical protein FOL47_003190 [Perkinsus chesapeaki]|uniref:Ankyrin Repeat Protein n=1 Tax=Perkinsus chesapeaki TaxID=330153 RepID=A0A7J6M8Z5_PERCH|nr:hypothetical protein FOL47_003190 [Perkinsus chesapeaki]
MRPSYNTGAFGEVKAKPFYAACQQGDVAEARKLLYDDPTESTFWAENECVPCPLTLAVHSQSPAMVIGKAMIAAAMVGNLKIMSLLSSADPSIVDYEDLQKDPPSTPLLAADEAVRTLLDLSASPIGPQPEGFTPLHMAAHTNSTWAMEMLLGRTSVTLLSKVPGFCGSASEGENQPSVIHVAIRRCNLELVQLLLRHRADPTSPSGPDGVTPLMIASQNGNAVGADNIVNFLLTIDSVRRSARLTCGPTPTNSDVRYTALHFAAEAGCLKAVRTLLISGASPNKRTDSHKQYGHLPLDLFRARARPELGGHTSEKEALDDEISQELTRCGLCDAKGSTVV